MKHIAEYDTGRRRCEPKHVIYWHIVLISLEIYTLGRVRRILLLYYCNGINGVFKIQIELKSLNIVLLEFGPYRTLILEYLVLHLPRWPGGLVRLPGFTYIFIWFRGWYSRTGIDFALLKYKMPCFRYPITVFCRNICIILLYIVFRQLPCK